MIEAVAMERERHAGLASQRNGESRISLRSSGLLAFPVLPNAWLGTSVENRDYLDRIDLLRRVPAAIRFISFEPLLGPIVAPDLSGIHWAIFGGESGPRARPMERWWAEQLRDDCQRQDVKLFFKQWGGKRKKTTGRQLGGRTWDDYPNNPASL